MFSVAAMAKYASLVGVGGFIAAAGYDFHRGSDQNTTINEIRLEQTELLRDSHKSQTLILNSINDLEVKLMTAIRDKQEACKVLEATVTGDKYKHTFECK